MSDRVYISNIAKAWPPVLQEALLAVRVPRWPEVSIFRDTVRPRALRDRDKDQLTDRAQMIRPTKRQKGGLIHVAALAVMAWRKSDFREVCEALAARGDCIVAHADSKVFDLANPLVLEEAVAHFPISRTESGRRKGRLAGAKASAATRNARSKAAAEGIRSRWGADGQSAKTLCAEAGYTYHTMVRWLGKWEPAKRRRERNAKRLAKALANAAEGRTNGQA